MTFRTVSIKARDAKVGDLIHSLRAGPYVQETLSSIDYMGYVSNSDPYLLKLRPYLAVGNDEEINNAAHLLHLAGPLVKDASEIQLVKGLQRKVYRLEFDADTPQLIHPDRLTLVRDYLLQQMHLDRLGGLIMFLLVKFLIRSILLRLL